VERGARRREDAVSNARVIVCYRTPGFHRWSAAPHDVWFLSANHRHVFTFRVELGVSDDDREVEFFRAQQQLKHAALKCGTDAVDVPGVQFGGKSCEMLGREVAQRLPSLMPGVRVVAVEVWEDDENGARIEF
jgi:hypothetical protein